LGNHQSKNLEDLVEWLISLWAKLVAKKSKWKPSCFIVDDVPQEQWALQWVLLCLVIFS
jgi:hypothetical protein